MKEVKINSQMIGDLNPTFITFEIGPTHNGIDSAKRLIKYSAEFGANAVKFQIFDPEKIVADKNQLFEYEILLNKQTGEKKLVNEPLYNILKRRCLSLEQWQEIKSYCDELDIAFFATVGFERDIELLEDIGCDSIKIASADINNLPLLKAVAKKNKPVVLSTGASTIEEISFSIKYLKEKGCPNISILHCVLNYPTLRKNANLNIIRSLKKNFLNNVVGYSDHTLPDKTMSVLKRAFLYGAEIIEKHFTLDKSLPGNDHYHAMDELDLKTFISEINEINEISGNKEKQVLKSEKISRKNARRSIVIKNQILKGTKIKEKDIISKRPGTGISSVEWENIVGKEVKYDLKKDHILQYTDLKK